MVCACWASGLLVKCSETFLNRSFIGILMWRIKTQMIKRMTFELIKNHRDKFTTQFEDNKKAVGELIGEGTKKIRNAVAGYVTRLMKVGVE